MITEDFISNLELDSKKIQTKIASNLKISLGQTIATLELFSEGCTVPFIARYRKEKTGNLDETIIREIEHSNKSFVNLETRRIEIIKNIFSQGKLSEELLQNLNTCASQASLEDIYAPYKQKRKTRGMKAIEAGLEPLAEFMLISSKKNEIETKALEFLNEEFKIETKEDAINGAMDILAERISQNAAYRTSLYTHIFSTSVVKVTGNKEKNTSVYGMYYDYAEPLSTLKPHRVLALNRGESEKELDIKIDIDDISIFSVILEQISIQNDFHKEAIQDGIKRLLLPAVLREIRSNLTDNADSHSIELFASNLKNLLLQQPIKCSQILAFDPGIRTGTKVVVLDKHGKFLHYFTFFQNKSETESQSLILDALKKFNVELIAIGNGTGSYEVQTLLTQILQKNSLKIPMTVVDEDGASVYSASPIAKEEFPELDVSIRGAISIGRRLLDPLSELVKIDPKSIGVGLYQHDVNQVSLGEALDETVESVVNAVGVNLNTASYSLLRYVSGLKANLAKKIVSYRDLHGRFKNRMDLLKVTGMGEKTFEQAAGFLKIPDSEEALDNTWVHPENYALAQKIWPLLKKGELSKEEKTQLSEEYKVSVQLVKEISNELEKPSRDPREDYPGPCFQEGLRKFEDLSIGMSITGKVKNVVDFGAFVDIGIKESALLHLSEISDKYIKHPSEVLKVGDLISAKIIDLDKNRQRIALSMRSNSVPKKKNEKISSPKQSVKQKQNNSQTPVYNAFAELLKNKK